MELRATAARSILSRTSGFIAHAGFTHSLTPARNCTFGCTYCYVPTMRIQGGLKPEDWKHWGHFTTFKSNAPELLDHSLKPDQLIYCSPLTDPYQPAEEQAALMPRILEALLPRPPRLFCVQTRGPLILRDIELLKALNARVSFSITTDREDIRRIYEPHCASIAERFQVIEALRAAGIVTFATLSPLLPCDPENLMAMAIEATDQPIIADPFHQRVTKPNGATTREAAVRISERRGFVEWHDAAFQSDVLARMAAVAACAGRDFGVGIEGFAKLCHPMAGKSVQ
jgi:DNA repair photolyase